MDYGQFWIDLLLLLFSTIATYWYIPVGYLTVYAIGAVSFILLKRFKTKDGRIIINRKSLDYRIAHPIDYHRKTSSWVSPKHGNVCTYFARFFHMLIFAWPIFIASNILFTISASVIGLLLFSKFVTISLKCLLNGDDFPVESYQIGWDRKKLPPGTILGLAVIIIAILNFSILWQGILLVGTVLLYALPPILLIGLIVGIGFLIRKKEPDTVNLVVEQLSAKKEKFCKMVEFR
jgi:hypothetical protein